MPLEIIGTGKYLPSKIVHNSIFEGKELYHYDKDGQEILEKGVKKTTKSSSKWIEENMGPLQRRRAADDEYVHSMGAIALQEALKDAGKGPEVLDAIIAGTVSSQKKWPSSAMYIQETVGARNVKDCYDVYAGCSGFVAGLRIAQGLGELYHGTYAVLGMDTLSKFGKPEDVNMPLWGDGAGAAILSYTDKNKGILASCFYSDPFDGNLDLIVNGPGDTLLMPNGNAVFKKGVHSLVKSAREVMAKAGWEEKDILLIAHQANIRMLEKAGEILHLRPEQLFVNIAKYGNMSSATCIIAIAEAREQGRISEGTKVVITVVGASLNTGAAAIQF
jgi:3-oxoacyl-[acyl-carrier-protein] synthase-3